MSTIQFRCRKVMRPVNNELIILTKQEGQKISKISESRLPLDSSRGLFIQI